MAASRSALEALLARVQQRAAEPRRPALVARPSERRERVEQGAEAARAAQARPALGAVAPGSGNGAPGSTRERRSGVAPGSGNGAPSSTRERQLPPQAAHRPSPSAELGDEDVEEYADDLIEIIDDARLIPQAAAAARAIEPVAYGARAEGRGPLNGKASSARSAAGSQPGAGSVRPQAVAARQLGARQVARAEGQRRAPRAATFLELLDDSLKLGA